MIMRFKSKDIYTFFIFIAILLLGIVSSEKYSLIFFVLITYFYVSTLVQSKSSVHMMFFLGYSSFIFLPALLNWYYLDTKFDLYFITSFASVFFLYATQNTLVKHFIDYGKQTRLIFIMFSIIAILLSLFELSEIVQPLIAFIIFQMSISFRQSEIKNNVFYFTIFLFVYLAFAILAWDGFGRTVVVGWLLLAILQFCYSINFKINKYIFGLIPGLASTLLSERNLLKLSFSGFEAALDDSAYQPYRLASSFIDQFNNNGFDISGFFDQILFTFFIFVPRSIWPNKPNGFGFEYTVRNFDQYLIDAGHSVASTLIADHIYFIGYLGILSSITVLLIIAYVIRIFYRIEGLNGNAVVIFSASMMVLVWGGMTSFSARVALPSIIFIILIALLKRFFTGQIRFRLRIR